MKFALTNDDGIDEPGISALADVCRELGEIVVVAPATPQSGISHQVTEDGEIRIDERGPNRFAIHGTPADCARIALLEICPDADWLIAGINAGANVGVDVYVSGTVAAARQAAIHGYPALALSQYFRRYGLVDWARTARLAGRVLRQVLDSPAEPGEFWCANLPDPTGPELHDEPTEIVECLVDPSASAIGYERTPAGVRWKADYHSRPRRARHDVDVCFGGSVALTRMRVAP
jgi:5'-nucleotidase